MSTLESVKGMSAKHPVWTEASLRWIVFQADNPASKHAKFAAAIHRVGGRVLIDEPLFIAIAKGEA